jgi:hypothetical protein
MTVRGLSSIIAKGSIYILPLHHGVKKPLVAIHEAKTRASIEYEMIKE